MNDFNAALVPDQQKRKRVDECGKTCASLMFKVHTARRYLPSELVP